MKIYQTYVTSDQHVHGNGGGTSMVAQVILRFLWTSDLRHEDELPAICDRSHIDPSSRQQRVSSPSREHTGRLINRSSDKNHA